MKYIFPYSTLTLYISIYKQNRQYLKCINAKRPEQFLTLVFSIGCLVVTYSHTNVRCTTIGVTAFHFCVRNGNRWFYSTMAARRIGFKTRNLTSFSLSKVWFNLITYSRCLPGLYGQDVQIISIGKLHSSRSFHIQPINVVVCNGLY